MSSRIAAGAVASALLLGGAGASGRLAVAVLLGAVAVAVCGWLLAGSLGQRVAGWNVVAASAGAAAIALRLLIGPPVPPPANIALPDGAGPWRAAVISVGSLREGARPAMVELIDPAGVRLAATFPAWPVVVPGDAVDFEGPLEPRPDGEYGTYLFDVGAAGIVRARAVTVEAAPGDLGRALEGLRRGADEGLRIAIPEPEAGLAAGILIGLRDRVDRALAADFTTVGATHVVAISGWNIAIVATTLGAVAGRVARRRRAALTALAIVVYVVFVGASPSVVRAAAMAGVVLIARELGRPSRAAAAIGWAVALLLLVDPRLVDDIGFRLSALATGGLILWGTPLADRLAGPTPGRLRAWLAESLGVSLAAQLATLPIVALEFGRLSIVSPVVNLGVVPLVAPAMAAGALALVAGLFVMAGAPTIFGTLLGLPAWMLLATIVGTVRAGASVPFASLPLEPPWDAAMAALAGFGIFLADGRLRRRPGPGGGGARGDPLPAGRSRAQGTAPTGARRPRLRGPRTRSERLLAVGLAGATAALAIAVVHRPDGIARLTVLDVGQGDAILLEGARGTRLLVDGGPDPGRLLVALDEHLPPWDRRIDVVVLSHPHEDHAAGLAVLLGRYRVRQVREPGMIGPGPGYAALNAALATSRVSRAVLATGDRLAVDDVRLEVLWPDPGRVPELPPDGGTGINNVSIVMLGEVGRHRFLLSGDIEEEIDPVVLARGLPEVEILKVAHHGSRTSSTAPLLATLRPRIAIISSGRGNPYGHPSPATIERIEAVGARAYRTDTNGAIELELGPGPIRVRPAKAAVGDGSALASGGAPRPLSPAPATTLTGTRTLPAFLCGVPALRPPTVVDRPPGPPARAASSPGIQEGSAGWVHPATDPEATLGYHQSGDHPHSGPADVAVDARSPRLLLGRRFVRHRGRRGGPPERPRSLPRRGPGTLARPRRGRRLGPHHRGPPRAALHGDDVRVGDPCHLVERGTPRSAR